MRIKNNKFRFGFIDPISIFTGLFFVATLIVSAAVVKNKNFTFNINEKAAVQKDDCAYGVCGTKCCSAPAPKTNKDTVANAPAPKPKEETTKLCGYCKDTGTCVSCTNGGENVGECSTSNDCKKGSVNLPPDTTQQPLATTPIDNKLEQAEVKNIQEVITAPVVINGTVVNPATSVPAEKPAVVEAKSPQTVLQQPIPTSTPIVSTSSTCNNSCPSTQKCVLIGMGYYGCQNISGPNSITTYVKPDCDNNCATNQECKPLNDGYYCKTVEYVPVARKCPSGSTWIDNTCVSNQVIQNQPDTSVVNTSVQDFINSFGTYFNNSNQPTLPENFNPQMSAFSMAGGQSSQISTNICADKTGAEYQNCINGLLSGTQTGNNVGIVAGSLVYGGAVLPAIGQSVLSNSVVQSILPYYALADIADTTIATIQCGASGDPSSPACSTAVASLIAPPGAGIADDMSDAMHLFPTSQQLKSAYGEGIIEDLKRVFRQEYNYPEVFRINPDEAISAGEAFNTLGGFNNTNLEFPIQGRNSQTAFFEFKGQNYVIKTEADNAIWSDRGSFETRSQLGFDNTMLAVDSPGLGVTRPTFFNLEDGSTASITLKIEGKTLSGPDIDEIEKIQAGLIASNRYLSDPSGNIIQQPNGLNVIIDYEGVHHFQSRDELFSLMNPEVSSLLDALGSPSTSNNDFFAEWRDR